ncbi:MAG: hypothetical protein D6739_08040 [Nitrospirae bacterium]|nr:MAG: hypothetical protein D6739_08040 [Nitrospirota bacterium]
MERRRQAVWIIFAAVLVLGASAPAVGWQRLAAKPVVIFGVETKAGVPLLVVRVKTDGGRTEDLFLALPRTVAAEVSRYIVRRAFPERQVEDAQLQAVVEVAALQQPEIDRMLDPLVRHGARQSYLRNVKFGLARLVREASRPTGAPVVFYTERSASGARLLTGVEVGRHRFEFGPQPAAVAPARAGGRHGTFLSWAAGRG